jgi:hypothetical protein
VRCSKRAQCRKRPSEAIMLDIVFLALGVGLFIGLAIYARLLNRL